MSSQTMSFVAFTDESEVEEALSKLGNKARIEFVNEPGNIVVSADTQVDKDEVQLWLERRGVRCIAFSVMKAQPPQLKTRLLQGAAIIVVVAVAINLVSGQAKTGSWSRNANSSGSGRGHGGISDITDRFRDASFAVPMTLLVVWLLTAVFGMLKLGYYYGIRRWVLTSS